MSHVIGIAVVDGQVASVVRDDNDAVVATHVVDVDDQSAASIGGAVIDLVSSAPFEVSRIGLVAPPAQVDALRAAFAPAPDRPVWFAGVSVDTVDSALVELTRTDATPIEGSAGPATGSLGGTSKSVAVVNLDEYTAPTSGMPIVTVDPQTGTITGRASWSPDHEQHTAVLDPTGAATVASAIASIPGSESITHVVFTGAGAAVPGVHAAFERALGRPVVIAPRPQFAIAGAAAGLARQPRPAYEPVSGAFAAQAPSTGRHQLVPEAVPHQVVPQAVGTPPAPQFSSAPYGSDHYAVGEGVTDAATVSLDEDGDPAPASDQRTRRRWWLIGGTTLAGFVILGAAIAAVLFSTGTAQRVVGVTTVSVTTQTTTVTNTETERNNTVHTTTVTPPTHTKTVTKTTTQPATTVTETETETITETETQQGQGQGQGQQGPSGN